MNPLVLVVLDGWGLNPLYDGNPTLHVATPYFDYLLKNYPHTGLHASGQEVGLSWAEMGNSEVGHLNLGCGRIIMQNLPRINQSIEDKSFFNNPELLSAFEFAKTHHSNIHLIGLASAGGVHSHLNHLLALIDLAKMQNFNRIFLHLITDGRDTPPKAALNDLSIIKAKFNSLGFGKIASVLGRYFAMDRDQRWERTKVAYDCLVNVNSSESTDPDQAIKAAYNQGQSDEFINPLAIKDTPRISDNDAIILFNFRPDRMKQLSTSIIDIDFKSFDRHKILKNIFFVSFTNYGFEPQPQVKVAFFAEKINNQLAKIIAENNLIQFHLAETEKYPHITYFFNGGTEKPFTNEIRSLIPSPKVATYDLSPQMSAKQVTASFEKIFIKNKPVFTVMNFANPDMVGHTGNMEAVKEAIITVDQCLKQVGEKVFSNSGRLLVTADHGNAEQIINPETGEIDKEHTTNPVPLILGIEEKRFRELKTIDLNYKMNYAALEPTGVLADVTSTILDLLGLPIPADMSGRSLKDVI